MAINHSDEFEKNNFTDRDGNVKAQLKKQNRRRLLFGANVVFGILIVLAIVVLVNFAADRLVDEPIDATRSGQFQISPRTVKLLKGLHDDITITAMYRVSEDLDKSAQLLAQKQKRQLEDLLKRYASISNKISYQVLDPLKDTAAKTKFIKNLKVKYAGQAAGHKAIVDEFKKLGPQILNLLDTECTELQKLAENNESVNKNKTIIAIYYRFTKDYKQAKAAIEDVDVLISGDDVPNYSQSVTIIQQLYDEVKKDLDSAGKFLAAEGMLIDGLPAATVSLFGSSQQRYKSVTDAIDSAMLKFAGLPRLELEEIYLQVKPGNAKTVIVQIADEPKSKVLSFSDIWKTPRQKSGDPREFAFDFNGEAAISSAMLSLTAKERAAVIFVHAGGPDPVNPTYTQVNRKPAPYQAAREKLEQANFVVVSWDLLRSSVMPEVANVSRKIFVVVPSVPQKNPAGGSPIGGYDTDQIKLVSKLVDQGERVLFLVNFQPTFMGKPYAFTELFKNKFGVKLEAEKLILTVLDVRGESVPNHQIAINRYGDHEITRPIESLNSTFVWAVPLSLEDSLPKGIAVTPLVSIDKEAVNCWAESDVVTVLQRGWAGKDEKDTAAPFNIAVAVTDNSLADGKIGKTVIFGNELFATDGVANQVTYGMGSQGLVAQYINPGNLELLTNTIFWLNDNANLISVGPRQSDMVRIENISENGMTAWKIFLWGVWPFMILICGGIVYLFRRK